MKKKEEEEDFYLNQAIDTFMSTRQNGPFMTIITRVTSTPTVDINDINIDDIAAVIDEALSDQQNQQNESNQN